MATSRRAWMSMLAALAVATVGGLGSGVVRADPPLPASNTTVSGQVTRIRLNDDSSDVTFSILVTANASPPPVAGVTVNVTVPLGTGQNDDRNRTYRELLTNNRNLNRPAGSGPIITVMYTGTTPGTGGRVTGVDD